MSARSRIRVRKCIQSSHASHLISFHSIVICLLRTTEARRCELRPHVQAYSAFAFTTSVSVSIYRTPRTGGDMEWDGKGRDATDQQIEDMKNSLQLSQFFCY